MKFRALIGSALLVLSIPALAFQNEPKEFRGIKWGEDFAVRTNEMTFLRENAGGTKWYLRKDDKMFLGDAQLSELTYGYANGRFMAVTIFTSGAENRKALASALLSQFGKPDERSDGVSQINYVWGSMFLTDKKKTDTHVNFNCGYKIRPTPATKDDCSVQFISNKILNELWKKKWKRQEENTASAKRKASDYIEVTWAVYIPFSDQWKLIQIFDGWAIYDNFADNGPFQMTPYLIAVKVDGIRDHGNVPLVKGESLPMTVGYQTKLGRLSDAPSKTRDGFDITVRRYVVIERKP